MDEACRMLWEIRVVDPFSSLADLKEAIETIAENYEPIRRSEFLTAISDQLEQGDHAHRDELVAHALKLAISQSGSALDHTAVHGVHVRLGKRAFKRGDLKQARRHLLSAAFGLPKNGECNYWLGEVYRALEKPRRAWSRYFQAILDPRNPDELHEACLSRLEELNNDPRFRATFSMLVAEQYMAGRLNDFEFHANTRHQQVKNEFPGHVRLVEFFTDANEPSTGGMQLAFQSLDEFFQGHVALIEYHVNDPMRSEVAVDRLNHYGRHQAPLAVFDGHPALKSSRSRAHKLSENAAANEPSFHEASLLKEPAENHWRIEADIKQDGTIVSGAVSLAGEKPEGPLRLHLIVCERSVMAVERNGVFFHQFVARAALSPPDGIALQTALDAPVGFSLDAAQLRDDLLKRQATLSEHPADLVNRRRVPTYVDANKLIVTAFVQHEETREVLAARSFHLPQEEELP